MDIATFVKIERKKNNLTQIQLSKKAGVGLRFIRELEQGKKTLKMDKINAVLFMFGKEIGVKDIE
jgi:y4mF family transcriptional regulator